jgi:hypothetical protein
LSNFLGLKIKQFKGITFVSRCKYIKELKRFGMEDAKLIRTPMGTNGHLDMDARGKLVIQKVYQPNWKSTLFDRF